MPRLDYHENLNSLLTNRHRHIIKRHVTLGKLLNIGRCLRHYAARHDVLASKPVYIKVETTDCCNLRCPSCHDGSVERKNRFLDFGIYTGMIDSLADSLLEVSLFDQGEPLLDPAIIRYVRYANERNIGTVISTHFSLKLADELLVELIRSGLDYLQVAIDGVTQATYQQYRVGGRLDLALANLTRLIELKKQLRSATPYVEWQMIDFEFNRHEQAPAAAMARSLGVDRFILKPDGRSWNAVTPHRRRKRCLLLWSTLAVECDGMVSACLINDHDSLYVGDLNRESIQEVWNSARFRRLRAFHESAPGREPIFCQQCRWFDGRA